MTRLRQLALPLVITALAVMLSVLALLGVIGPSPSPDEVVDGWAVSDRPAECSGQPVISNCDTIRRLATAAFDAAWPGHFPVIRTEVRAEGTYPNPRGGPPVLLTRSVGVVVVLFELLDGSRHAVGVACGFVPTGRCQAFTEPPSVP